MRSLIGAGLAALLVIGPALAADAPAPEKPAVPVAVQQEMEAFWQTVEGYVALGIDRDKAWMLALMSQQNTNPMLLLGMLDAEDDAGKDNPLGGMMTAMLGGLGSLGGMVPPSITAQGNTIFLAENGVLYKIDGATMQVQGEVRYRGVSTAAAVLAARAARAAAKAVQPLREPAPGHGEPAVGRAQ
jgi:hypothetical protein